MHITKTIMPIARPIYTVVAAILTVSALGWLVYHFACSSDPALRSWEIARADLRTAQAKHDWKRARRSAEGAIRLAGLLGAGNYRVAASLVDLAAIESAQNNGPEGSKLLGQAIDLLDKNLKLTQPQWQERLIGCDLAYALSKLAFIQEAAHDYDNAAKSSEKSIRLYEKWCHTAYKKDQLDYFTAHQLVRQLDFIARTYLHLNRLDDAGRSYRRCVDLADQSFYPANLSRQIKLAYADLLRRSNSNKNGSEQEAQQLFSDHAWGKLTAQAEEALDAGNVQEYEKLQIESARVASSTPSTYFLAIISLRKLAKFYAHGHQNEAANKVCRQALDLKQKLGGGADSEIDTIYGVLYKTAPDKAAALQALNSRLSLRQEIYGRSDYHVAETYCDLALTCSLSGQTTEAKDFAQKSFEIYQHCRVHKGGGSQILQLAGLLDQFGDFRRSAIIYERALQFFLRSTKPNRRLIGETLKKLDAAYQAQGDNAARQRIEREYRPFCQS